jgi:hypothetical protein
VAELLAVVDLGSNAARFTLASIISGRGFCVLREERVQTADSAPGAQRRDQIPGVATGTDICVSSKPSSESSTRTVVPRPSSLSIVRSPP